MPDGRVLIAFDDGPLVASPTWTRLDSTNSLVADIEIVAGGSIAGGEGLLERPAGAVVDEDVDAA